MRASPLYLFAFLLFILSGCIDEYQADISSDDSGLLVVEGAICPGVNKFVLTRTLPVNSSYMPQMVTGANVSVHGSDGSEYLMQEANGYYTCNIEALNPDATYYLRIVETDGEVYESEPQKPLRTEKIQEVNLVQDTPESNIDVLVTPEAPDDPGKTNYYSWTYDETWEVHPDYTTTIYFDIKTSSPVFDPYQFPSRGWKSMSSSTILVGNSRSYEGQHIQRLKLYDIDRSHERVYYKYSGLVHQRSISKAEYEYDLARRQASSEMGGLFTPLPSALPTNIHCLTSKKHVIGFVGCSLNTSEYRFFLVPKDFSITRTYPKDARRWLDDCTEKDCYQMVTVEGMYLCEWKDERYRPGGVLQTAWAYDYQLDVRLWGATDEEPDYWSLEEDYSY